MVILLKIVLTILSIALGYTTYFIYSEYNKFKKSPESDNASLMEKFTLATVAFCCIAVLLCAIILFGFVIASNVSIVLPFNV